MNFKNYIGVKVLQATPLTLGEYNKYRGWTIPEKEDPSRPGYLVKYPDGYESWSPKEIFETSYLDMGEDTTKIGQAVVDEMVAECAAGRMDDGKTTLVKVELITGFTQYATSACVDPKNYDEKIGSEIGGKEINNKIWFALGFMLQWAKFGLKNTPKK